jgi:hypothetical protein
MPYYSNNGGLIGPGTISSRTGVHDLDVNRLINTGGTVAYTSRATGITEGLTSDFLTAQIMTSTWNYTGNNSDAIAITTSGTNAILDGWSMGNHNSGTNGTWRFTLYIISGNGTGGTVLKTESFENVTLNTATSAQTMLLFTGGGILLTPGTYTIVIGWGASQSNVSRAKPLGSNRSSSSITVGGNTLNVSYSNAVFNGNLSLGTSNGTSADSGNGQGQLVTLQWRFQ